MCDLTKIGFDFLQSFAHSQFMVLLMIVVMLLLLGTFMDLAPMILWGSI